MRIDQSELDCLNVGRDINPVKKHKYNAISKVVDGHKFPSIHEATRYTELKFQQHCKFISDLKIQPKKFILQPGFRHKFQKRKFRSITYTPDFSFIKDNKLIYEDAKGMDTAVYINSKKMLLSLHPDINFQEYRK